MSITRRHLLKVSMTSSGGVVFALSLPACGSNRQTAYSELNSSDKEKYTSLYFEVTPKNEFFFNFDKAEMGQGVITGQATLFGEEADIHPERLIMRPALADKRYATAMGHMITGGSTSTPDRFELLRRVGATYREHLLTAAATQWNVAKSEISTSNGTISHDKSGKSAAYADFNQALVNTPPPDIESVPLKNKADWKYIGKFSQSIDAYEKSTGSSDFGLDFELPDMKTAILLRSPVFGGTLKAYDADALKAIEYVHEIKKVGDSLAIICDSYWQCLRARRAISDKLLTWEIPAANRVSTADLEKKFQSALKPANKPKGDKIYVTADYHLPYLAHAPMEPLNGVAWYHNNTFEAWVSSQGPTLIQNYAAEKTGIKREDIVIHNAKYLGGGFGRRGNLDFHAELVDLAVQVNYPIKLIWSREDGMRHSPMRPMSTHRLEAVMGESIETWKHQIAGQSILQDLVKSMIPLSMPEWLPGGLRRGFGSMISGGMDTFGALPVLEEGAKQAYNLPFDIKTIETETHIPVTFWRSVGSSHNGFVVESFLDEVIHAMKKDPLDARLELLKKDPRALGVVKAVAEGSRYKATKPTNQRALGLAYHKSFNSYVAEVADVEIKDSKIFVRKVWAAIDVGTVINPDIVKKQVESGIIYGLSAALYGKMEFENGEVVQSNFHDYPLLRLSETPEIKVILVDSDKSPTGIGEPGLPPIAAAVGNAIFNITGQRLRRLPFELG